MFCCKLEKKNTLKMYNRLHFSLICLLHTPTSIGAHFFIDSYHSNRSFYIHICESVSVYFMFSYFITSLLTKYLH